MTTRRLAAILAADVVGFSSMMEKDEEGTLRRVKTLQREVIEPRVKERGGRLVKTTGDGFLIEFSSPVEAVRCAMEIKEKPPRRTAVPICCFGWGSIWATSSSSQMATSTGMA
jgi:adenylate cyclase